MGVAPNDPRLGRPPAPTSPTTTAVPRPTPNTTIPGKPANGRSAEDQAFIDQITAASDERTAIGVPKGYKATRAASQYQSGAFQVQVDPKYFDGAQYEWQSKDPAEVLRLQLRMQSAGILPKGYRARGNWDQVSADAMEQMMAYANRGGSDWEQVLQQWAELGPAEEKTGAVLQLKNPEEIKRLLQDTSGKVLGRSLSEAEANRIVRGYQDLDRIAQEQAAAAQAAAQEGEQTSYVEPLSVETYAEQQLRQQFKPEADYQTGVSRMQEFYSILGEGGGMGGLGNG